MKIEFSNPRTRAEIADYPLGGTKRGQCVFQVQRTKKGCRVSRTTFGKPKLTTFCTACCIVDGSDGRTYILEYSELYTMVSIRRSDYMSGSPDEMGRPNTYCGDIGDDDKKAEYAKLLRMITDSGVFALPMEAK